LIGVNGGGELPSRHAANQRLDRTNSGQPDSCFCASLRY
jgi:hypothetical protein